MVKAVLHHISSDFGKSSSIGFRSQMIFDYAKDKVDITVICRTNKSYLNKKSKKVWAIKLSYIFSRFFAFIRFFLIHKFPAREYELIIFNFLSFPYIFFHFLKNIQNQRYFHAWDTSLWLLIIVKKLNYIVIKDCAMTPSKISVIKYKENPNYYIDRFTTNKNISDEKKIFDLCQKIISPSPFTSKFINDHYKIPQKKIRTIPFGVNFEKYSNIIKTKSEHKDKIRFGFVGLVNMRKGIRWLIDDLNKIFEKNKYSFELHLFGRIFIEEKKFLDNAKFKIVEYGFVDKEKINIFSNFDVLIHPSFIEGSAKCIYEGMASGLPIICTEESGSLVKDKVNGFIIKAGDSISLVSSIEYFLKNKQKVLEMGNHSQEIIKTYTWDRYARKVTQNYLR